MIIKRIAINIGTVIIVLTGCNQINHEHNKNTKMNRNGSISEIIIPDSIRTLKTEKDSIFNLGISLNSKADTIIFVQNIIEYKDSIDKGLNTFVKTDFESSGDSAEGGLISTYHNKKDTVKIKAIFYGETGQNQYDFYLEDKKIIAVNETLKEYKSPIGNENVRIVIDKMESHLFILNGNKILMSYGKNTKTDFNYEQKAIDITDIYKEILFVLHKNL